MKKQQFLEFWKNIENKDTQYRAFYLICSDKNKKFIIDPKKKDVEIIGKVIRAIKNFE